VLNKAAAQLSRQSRCYLSSVFNNSAVHPALSSLSSTQSLNTPYTDSPWNLAPSKAAAVHQLAMEAEATMAPQGWSSLPANLVNRVTD
jgi:hypothetical protein